jgi:hypothetical protein
VEVGIAVQIDRPFLAKFRPLRTEVSYVAWRGAPLEMTSGTKGGAQRARTFYPCLFHLLFCFCEIRHKRYAQIVVEHLKILYKKNIKHALDVYFSAVRRAVVKVFTTVSWLSHRFCRLVHISAAFPKLWSSGSALVVLLDWTLVQKRQEK